MSKDYGQFCGLAEAASILGERWTLLIVRDLSVGPRRFKELHEGLPGIPTSGLTTRLRELETAGVVERQVAEAPQRGLVYRLTAYGQQIRPVLDALGAWGAQRMSQPKSHDVITSSSLAAALRAGYQPGEITSPTTYVLHVGPATAWATTHADDVSVGTGTPDNSPELTIYAGPGLRLLMAGRITAAEALDSAVVEIVGPQRLLESFRTAFHVPLDDSIAISHNT